MEGRVRRETGVCSLSGRFSDPDGVHAACGSGPAAKQVFFDQAEIRNPGAVRMLVDLGLISGYTDGSFRPAAPVTREEIAKVIARLCTDDPQAENLTGLRRHGRLVGQSLRLLLRRARRHHRRRTGHVPPEGRRHRARAGQDAARRPRARMARAIPAPAGANGSTPTRSASGSTTASAASWTLPSRGTTPVCSSITRCSVPPLSTKRPAA